MIKATYPSLERVQKALDGIGIYVIFKKKLQVTTLLDLH